MFRLFFLFLTAFSLRAQTVRLWTTTEDLRLRMVESSFPFSDSQIGSSNRIQIDPRKTFQTMLGMGASFEHSSCSNLFLLLPEKRAQVIARLVSPKDGIGMNLMRICIGTSDFAGEDWYTFDDRPKGQTDRDLTHFSIERDRSYILPVLKAAKKINPDLLFFASPWSPPGWMKTSGSIIGGDVLPKYYSAYAHYFVRFIQAYEAEGIPIYAVTVQNEPGVDRSKGKDPKSFYPSCHWTAEQERLFIRDHLGPAFRRARLHTKIWCYDHNYNVDPKGDSDGLAHPRAILNDPNAAAFVDGVAFHHYEGQPEGMTLFHNQFPSWPIHFTEGSLFSIYAGHDLIERLRNWSTSYNAWVTLLDEKGRPNNGPFPATTAILRLHSDTSEVEELLEFYNYAHFTKFIQRGAKRIQSTPGNVDLNNVAFQNPDGSLALVIVNTSDKPRSISAATGKNTFVSEIKPKSISTFLWTP